MLPFLKYSKEASVSMAPESIKRKSDSPEESEYDPMHSAADDLISAVHSKDTKATADALRAAFELADSEPHHEGPHIEEGE